MILASASPRREELLKQLKIPFRVIPSRLFEPPPNLMSPAEYARKLALAKARLVAKKVGEGLVLGADTIVVHRGEILGKPTDLRHAIAMLTRLQGSTHRVITGVALVDAATAKEKSARAVSAVTMRRLTVKEIAALARKNLDKAGAYAVQEKKDALVTRVRGSYSNVVGLPLSLVKALLLSFRGR
ncbi:MAG: septum formation protein Maf [Candidatus Omnitrophica bacterium]|nr:septum formation protein Maf [Candidatus Omnitrophota bacterium]